LQAQIAEVFHSKAVELFYSQARQEIKDGSTLFSKSEGLDLNDLNKLMRLKLFLWPYYRLEDLACMNRYWFDTSNGSRFSMLRIHPYPRF
jgi:hypothetical protein